MNNRRRKLNIKRVIIAIAILITILLIVGLVFPKLLAALIILFFIISTIIVMIREWKGILLFSVLILSYTLLDNSVINTVVLGFFFNIVYISLSFSPKWNRRKIRIQRYIEENGLKDMLSFNVPFFEQVRDREKAIITMFFYSISILPSVTLKILQDKKDFIFDHVPLSHDAYSLLLHLFKVNEFSPIVLKRICVSFFLILAYLIIITIIIMVTKESRLILKEIRIKYDRDTTYWNNEKIELDDDDLIFLDVKGTTNTNK